MRGRCVYLNFKSQLWKVMLHALTICDLCCLFGRSAYWWGQMQAGRRVIWELMLVGWVWKPQYKGNCHHLTWGRKSFTMAPKKFSGWISSLFRHCASLQNVLPLTKTLTALTKMSAWRRFLLIACKNLETNTRDYHSKMYHRSIRQTPTKSIPITININTHNHCFHKAVKKHLPTNMHYPTFITTNQDSSQNSTVTPTFWL